MGMLKKHVMSFKKAGSSNFLIVLGEQEVFGKVYLKKPAVRPLDEWHRKALAKDGLVDIIDNSAGLTNDAVLNLIIEKSGLSSSETSEALQLLGKAEQTEPGRISAKTIELDELVGAMREGVRLFTNIANADASIETRTNAIAIYLARLVVVDGTLTFRAAFLNDITAAASSATAKEQWAAFVVDNKKELNAMLARKECTASELMDWWAEAVVLNESFAISPTQITPAARKESNDDVMYSTILEAIPV